MVVEENAKSKTVPSKASSFVGLLIGVLAVSTASTFIRRAQETMPSLAVATWRLTSASLLLAPFALQRCRREWRALPRKAWLLTIVSGIFLALHFYAWITALSLTSVAAAVVLVTTSPLFVALISYIFFKERLSLAMLLGMLVAFVGSGVIAWGDLSDAASHYVLGDLLALIGALMVAIYMLIGRRVRAKLSLLGYIFPVYGVAALTLLLLSLLSGMPLGGYPPESWLWIGLLALIPQILGHSSFNWALGHLSATYVALATLAEPLASTLLAWVVLGEPPTLFAVLGGGLILFGLLVSSLKRPAR